MNQDTPGEQQAFSSPAGRRLSDAENSFRRPAGQRDEQMGKPRFRMENHPWLAQMTEQGDEDSVDEVIRYTLAEIRFA